MDAHLGRYHLLQMIGRGGMAQVWKARVNGPEGFEKSVAVKVIRSELSGDPKALDLFIQEAKLVAALHHANVAQVLDFGRHGDVYFIAMEYVQGTNLYEVIRAAKRVGRPLSVPVAAYLMTAIGNALDHAHSRSPAVIHRDVSPHNVLVSIDGQVKLTDFGIAHVYDAADPVAADTRGKVFYLSPEQARAGALTTDTDIFTLGLVGYELLAGERFFPGRPTREVLLGTLARFDEPSPTQMARVDVRLRPILHRCLRGDPVQRYRRASLLVRDVMEAVGALTVVEAQEELAEFMQSVFGGTYCHRVGSAATGAPDAPAPWQMNETNRNVGTNVETIGERTLRALDDVPPIEVEISEVDLAELEPDPEPAPAPLTSDPSSEPAPHSRWRWGWVGLSWVVVALLVGAGFHFLQGESVPQVVSAPEVGSVQQAVSVPQVVTVVATPVPSPSRSAKVTKKKRPRRAVRAATVPVRTPKAPARTPKATVQPIAQPTVEPTVEPTVVGWITVNARPWVEVWADGKRISKETPLRRYALAAGPHELELRNPEANFRATRRIVVTRGRHVTVFADALRNDVTIE